MGTIGDLLRAKGGESWSVPPTATVYEALVKMAEKDIGALLITEEGRLVGIFSERDYARKCILRGKASKDTLVAELMTKSVVCVTRRDTLEEAMTLMTSNNIRHLPVMSNDDVIGVITLGDVVKRIISDQNFTIDELENHFFGGYGT